MSDKIDDILDVIDAGLQSSSEHGYPEQTGSLNPDSCFRDGCFQPVAEGSDMCGPCREYMLGDTDVDPAGVGSVLDGCDFSGENVIDFRDVNGHAHAFGERWLRALLETLPIEPAPHRRIQYGFSVEPLVGTTISDWANPETDARYATRFTIGRAQPSDDRYSFSVLCDAHALGGIDWGLVKRAVCVNSGVAMPVDFLRTESTYRDGLDMDMTGSVFMPQEIARVVTREATVDLDPFEASMRRLDLPCGTRWLVRITGQMVSISSTRS